MTKKDEEAAKTAARAGDDPAAVVSEPAQESDESEVAQMQADLERFKDLAMRSQADFDNYRKRATRDKEEAIKYANASLLERLIPIIDNFDLGLAAAKDVEGSSPILAGMEMVAKQLADFLKESGLTAIEAVGQKFDPNLHEALAQEESSDVPEGHVLRQIRKGYKLRDRLLRPANVVVSKGKA